MIRKCAGLFSIICVASMAHGQEMFKPRISPVEIVAVRFKDAYLKITYGQPQKRGRALFGILVPYGEVWRTGANEATEITTTHDILIHDQLLRAGTYSLFTIPGPDVWTIIINRDVGLWGAYNYRKNLDILRFEVPVTPNNVNFEAFTLVFEQRNELADLLIMWDNIKLTIPFKFIN